MERNYKIINNVIGWLIGIFASAVYIMTAEPTASWWDCGEYISTAYKVLVGHPPGAPTFQLIGRFFSMFAGGDVTKVAFCINCMSAICSGLTIMFLFWTITMLGRKLVARMGGMTTPRMIAVFGSALVGSLAYTFTDSFWFSAVEGEVYAMSSFFTALVFWCILKWDYEYDNAKEDVNPNRWIVLITYLIGLSIGVHLLNLLTLPAIVLVIYFKLSKEATYMGVVQTLGVLSFIASFFFPGWWMVFVWVFITFPCMYYSIKKGTIHSKAEWGVFLSLVCSFILLGLILYGIIPQIVNLAGKFEIFFVNNIHLPFNSGTIIFFLLLAGLITWGLWYGFKKDKPILRTTVFSFLFLLIGYSTFFILVIRSNANPTIDENNPEDAVGLLAYLNREQYGSYPIFYGETYNSMPVEYVDESPIYVRDDAKKQYVISDPRTKRKARFAPDQTMLFPRMWDAGHKELYVSWLRSIYNTDSPKDKENRRLLKRNGIPTWQQNLTFMHTYQFYYMYLRYFMWNFSGRQNDIQGRGGNLEGNWISGIPFIDEMMVGNQNNLPESMKNPGHNKYYMLPLLLGLIGVVFYSLRDTKNSFIVLLLFAMTGLAIAFYLNMYPFQPRERDYAFAASFYAFAIWIGFGVFGIYSLFEKIQNNKVQAFGAIMATLLCLGLVPGIMASENWDDHDRSNRYTALAIAKNYLDSCAPNAILFTLGDNDTFPLWYAQEVEGYRTDVRVCNLSLLSTGWYIDQMKRKAYNSEPLPISMEWSQYKDGTRDVIALEGGHDQFLNIKDVVEYIKRPEFDQKRQLVFISNARYSDGKSIPASFSLPVDKAKVLANGTVDSTLADQIVDHLSWNLRSDRGDGINYLYKAYLVMMDILANNNWERPIYYASTTGSEAFFGLESYFQLEGLAYRLVPIKTAYRGGYESGRINNDILYNNLVNVFNDHKRVDRVNNPDAPAQEPYEYAWGGLNDPRVYNCEDNMRLTGLVRSIYIRLANSLLAAGDTIRAEKALDQCDIILNDKIMPYKMTYQMNFSLFSLDFIKTYFALNTSTGREKAIEKTSRYLDYIIEDFAWYESISDQSRKWQTENILNEFVLTSQLLKQTPLNDADLAAVKEKVKKIKFDQCGTQALALLCADADNILKNFENKQNELARKLSEMRDIATLSTMIGNQQMAEKANGALDHYLQVLTSMDPYIGQAFKNFLNGEQ